MKVEEKIERNYPAIYDSVFWDIKDNESK